MTQSGPSTWMEALASLSERFVQANREPAEIDKNFDVEYEEEDLMGEALGAQWPQVPDRADNEQDYLRKSLDLLPRSSMRR